MLSSLLYYASSTQYPQVIIHLIDPSNALCSSPSGANWVVEENRLNRTSIWHLASWYHMPIADNHFDDMYDIRKTAAAQYPVRYLRKLSVALSDQNGVGLPLSSSTFHARR